MSNRTRERTGRRNRGIDLLAISRLRSSDNKRTNLTSTLSKSPNSSPSRLRQQLPCCRLRNLPVNHSPSILIPMAQPSRPYPLRVYDPIRVRPRAKPSLLTRSEMDINYPRRLSRIPRSLGNSTAPRLHRLTPHPQRLALSHRFRLATPILLPPLLSILPPSIPSPSLCPSILKPRLVPVLPGPTTIPPPPMVFRLSTHSEEDWTVSTFPRPPSMMISRHWTVSLTSRNQTPIGLQKDSTVSISATLSEPPFLSSVPPLLCSALLYSFAIPLSLSLYHSQLVTRSAYLLTLLHS